MTTAASKSNVNVDIDWPPCAGVGSIWAGSHFAFPLTYPAPRRAKAHGGP
jgi:hypothetical protein